MKHCPKNFEALVMQEIQASKSIEDIAQRHTQPIMPMTNVQLLHCKQLVLLLRRAWL